MNDLRNRLAMVGTSMSAQGGVASVAKALTSASLARDFRICYVETHRDGGPARKASVAITGFFRFASLLVRRRIDLAHIHVASRASFWRKLPFVVAAKVARIPVVLHLHGAEFREFYESECGRLRRAIVRWTFTRADAVVVLSSSWEQWVSEFIPGTRTRVIPNPAPNTAAVERVATGERTVLFLGRVGVRKGVYDLLQAVAVCKAQHDGMRVVIAGDGDVDGVREAAHALGLSNIVDVIGWVGSTQVTGLLRAADVFVLPSYNEGLPMSVLEAMAHGVPVIATPVGGIPDAVRDGVEGYLVPPGDIHALADRLDRLLAKDALSTEMGRAASSRIEQKFSIELVCAHWRAIYGQLGVKAE